MKIIEAHGWMSFVTNLIEYGDDMFLVGFMYNAVHVDGIVASLLNKNQRTYGTSVTQIDGSVFSLDQSKNYRVIRNEVRDGRNLWTRAVLVRNDCTMLVDRPESLVFLVGKGAGKPDHFVTRLSRATGLPLLQEWEDWLWEEGLETGRYMYKNYNSMTEGVLALINQCGGYGDVEGYVVNQTKENWLRLIRRHLGLVTYIDQYKNDVQVYYESDDGKWMVLSNRNEDGRDSFKVFKNGNVCMEKDNVVGGKKLSDALIDAERKLGIQMELRNVIN